MNKKDREKLERLEKVKAVTKFIKDKNMNYWYIPGNVPSSKNEHTAYPIKRGGTIISCRLGLSAGTKTYREVKNELYEKYSSEFRAACYDLSPPYHVGFFFINKTSVLFDYINKAQMVQDMMVKNNWIDDDNITMLKPFFPTVAGHTHLVNSEYAGVIIMLKGAKHENS